MVRHPRDQQQQTAATSPLGWRDDGSRWCFQIPDARAILEGARTTVVGMGGCLAGAETNTGSWRCTRSREGEGETSSLLCSLTNSAL